MDRAIILGASRGLGAALVAEAVAHSPVMGFGRKAQQLELLRERHPLFEYRVADFSNHLGQDEVIRYLQANDFNKVFYVAGGGPFGPFGEREMKDHDWAWEVSYHCAARVLHTLLRTEKMVQVILVGSAVAESEGDPGASSYCASKHALKGLFQSLRLENPGWDLRLFSPGYMDTDMLPRNAAVRKAGVYDPAQIARDLWTWSLTTDDTGHKVYPKHSS